MYLDESTGMNVEQKLRMAVVSAVMQHDKFIPEVDNINEPLDIVSYADTLVNYILTGDVPLSADED